MTKQRDMGKRKKKVRLDKRDGWMDDLRFYVLFNSISVISGRWADENERLCAMEPRLRVKRSSPHAGIRGMGEEGGLKFV